MDNWCELFPIAPRHEGEPAGKSSSWAGGILVFDSNIDLHLWKTRRRHFILFFALLPALVALNSCGSSSTTNTTPTITVSGSASTVNVNGTVQFTATITNLSSTLVNWEVNSVIGGNLATTGAIDTNGKFTAPPNAPSSNIVTITAIAQAQTTLTGTATVTILPPATITGVTPTNATVVAGMQQTFTATFSSGTGNGVNWFINNSGACSATLGFPNGLVAVNGKNTYPYGQISSQGVYTAPLIPPPGGAIALTAVSQADAKQTFCVPVILAFGNASLQGSFAFSASGRVISSNAFFARAGSFTAGGSGAIIGGLETYNEVGQGGATQHTFLGTYDIGHDGRGTMQFCEDTAASSCTAPTVFFRVVIISARQARIIEFSQPVTPNPPASRTATGEMVLQDASVFSKAGLAGAYSFDFSGLSSVAAPASLSAVGEFSADSFGSISPSVISTIPGRMDINNGGTLSQPAISSTSNYSINANGQGTATLFVSGDPNYSQLAFNVYMVSASHAIFIESDGQAVLVGDATKQQANSCSWGNSSLNGLIVIETSGKSSTGNVTDLIDLNVNGLGVATAIASDENNAGVVSSSTTLAGSYNIDSCGRGTFSLSGPANHNFTFFMISSTSAAIQETTQGATSAVSHGLLLQPQSGSVTLGALNSFALNLAGTNAAGPTAREEDTVGQINLDKNGSLIANAAGTIGSLDINNFGTTQSVALTSGGVAAGSRATLVLNSAGSVQNFVLYFVSPTQFFVMGTDSSGTAIGSLYQQF